MQLTFPARDMCCAAGKRRNTRNTLSKNEVANESEQSYDCPLLKNEQANESEQSERIRTELWLPARRCLCVWRGSVHLSLVLDDTQDAWDCVDTRLLGKQLRLNFVSHGVDGMLRWADEDQPFCFQPFDKGSVLGEETVSWV